MVDICEIIVSLANFSYSGTVLLMYLTAEAASICFVGWPLGFRV